MRLKNMYLLCKRWLLDAPDDPIKQSNINIPNHGSTVFRMLPDWDAYRKGLQELGRIPALSGQAEKIIAAGNPQRITDGSLLLLPSEAQSLGKEIGILRERVDTLVSLCESMGYEELEEGQTGFDVMLPPDIPLEDCARCIKDIASIINQYPYLTKEDARVEFKMIDVGSTWLTFFIIGAGAVTLLNAIAHLIDTALIVRSHKISTDQQMETLKRSKIKTETLEAIVKAHDDSKDAILDAYASDLEEKCGELQDGEQHGHVKLAIDKLSDWMRRGLEIYAAIETDDKTKVLFPPVERQRLSDHLAGLLPEAKKD